MTAHDKAPKIILTYLMGHTSNMSSKDIGKSNRVIEDWNFKGQLVDIPSERFDFVIDKF